MLRWLKTWQTLIANEELGKERQLFMNVNGVKSVQMINDDVRKGKYEYKYSDNSAIAMKRQQYTEALELVMMAKNDPNVYINTKEVLKHGFDLIGIENTDKFFTPDEQPMQPSNYHNYKEQ